MRVGIIAPSKMDYLLEINKNAALIIEDVVKTLKGYEIYLVSDKGSVSELFAKKYNEFGGKNMNILVPSEDKEFGFEWINQEVGKNVNCGTWRNQPENLNERTDVLVCLGYSAGGLAEIAYSKWFKPNKNEKKPIYIINELISGKLPKELEKNLDLRYIRYDHLRIENGKR